MFAPRTKQNGAHTKKKKKEAISEDVVPHVTIFLAKLIPQKKSAKAERGTVGQDSVVPSHVQCTQNRWKIKDAKWPNQN